MNWREHSYVQTVKPTGLGPISTPVTQGGGLDPGGPWFCRPVAPREHLGRYVTPHYKTTSLVTSLVTNHILVTNIRG